MEKLINVLKQLNIPFDQETISSFLQYMDSILEWNEKINLTAITNRDEFIVKHFIDSIVCCNFDEYKAADSVIDIGTGAGFPGIPLAIISPDKKFTLADSLKKRINVIEQISGELGFDNIDFVHGRAEELARKREYRGQFDLCVSRAVANLPVLLEYCLPFIKNGGKLFAYKGPDAEQEVIQSQKAIKILGGKLHSIKPVELEGFEHNIVIIDKIKDTPAKYPRKAGTPSKEPIK